MSQYDLFPERVIIEPVDTRAAAGKRSRVKSIFVVQFERTPGRHQVFHDRHGWYCAEHGRECRAIDAVREHERGVPGSVVADEVASGRGEKGATCRRV